MKVDQIAFYCDNEIAENEIKKYLRLEAEADWITRDRVTGQSLVRNSTYAAWGTIAENVAELQFNYDRGIEIELIKYVSGPFWHLGSGSIFDVPFISHIGIHLDINESFPDMDNRMVQHTRTVQHTNPYLIEQGRTYEYKIYLLQTGNYLKYIRRIQS